MFFNHILVKGFEETILSLSRSSRGILYILAALQKGRRKVISILQGRSKLLEKENKCKVAKGG